MGQPHTPTRQATGNRICLGCRAIVPAAACVDGRCPRCSPDWRRHQNALRDTYARPAHRALYGSVEWRAFRLRILERDDHRCRLELPECEGVANTVHHLVPAADAPHLRFDEDNCVSACRRCHGKADGGRSDGGRSRGGVARSRGAHAPGAADTPDGFSA